MTIANGGKVAGVIRLVSPRVDANTKLGRVKIALPVRPDVRSGGFAEANFVGLTHSALAVPDTAVRYDAEGASVMAVGADDRLARIPVTTGRRIVVTTAAAGRLAPAGAGALSTSRALVLPGGN